MATVKCSIAELYELQAQLGGVTITQKVEGKDEPQITLQYTGILNEKGVTEGTKRGVLKNLRVLDTETETITKQRKEIAAYTEEGKTPEELIEIIKAKDAEVLASEIEFETELIDFSKIKDLAFSMNYQIAYEKLFKNYGS